MPRRSSKATCHPEEWNYGRGYCKKCYDRDIERPRLGELMIEKATREFRESDPNYIYKNSPEIDLPPLKKDDYFINQSYAIPKLLTV